MAKQVLTIVSLWKLNRRIKTKEGTPVVFTYLDALVFGYIARANYGGYWYNFVMKNAIHDLYTSEKEVTHSIMKLVAVELIEIKPGEHLPNCHMAALKTHKELEDLINKCIEQERMSCAVVDLDEERKKHFQGNVVQQEFPEDEDCPF